MAARTVAGLLGAGLILGAVLLSVDFAAADAVLPGVTGAEKYPRGCVDCHSGDESVGAMLDVLGHMDVSDRVQTVPQDCAACHDGEVMAGLAELVHLTHYRNAAENPFVGDYHGACLHCHALDTERGRMSTRSGPRNW